MPRHWVIGFPASKELIAYIFNGLEIQEECQSSLSSRHLRMKALCLFITLGTDYTVMWRCIPEEWCPQPHHCETLRLTNSVMFWNLTVQHSDPKTHSWTWYFLGNNLFVWNLRVSLFPRDFQFQSWIQAACPARLKILKYYTCLTLPSLSLCMLNSSVLNVFCTWPFCYKIFLSIFLSLYWGHRSGSHV